MLFRTDSYEWKKCSSYIVPVYKLVKIFTICVSVEKVPVARLATSENTEFTYRKCGIFGRA